MKKKLFLFLLMGMMLLLGTAFAAQAPDITSLCTITSPGRKTEKVHDGLYTSFWQNEEMVNGYLEFQTPPDQPAKWLYICFGEDTNLWEIQTEIAGNWQTLIPGSNIYSHILLDLGGQTHFRLVETSGRKTQFKINEVFVFGDGEVPEWVQQWQPPQEKADILLLVAHPDDELLFFGGTIPDYGVERGKSVVVAYMSYSNTTRKSELLNGLWSMGVRNYPVIGNFHDTYANDLEAAYTKWKQNQVDAFITELIRKYQPEVILTHDRGGEYGHGAHRLCADAVERCAIRASDPSFYPDSAAIYGVWSPKKVYLHLAKEGQIVMNWHVPLASQNGRTGLEAAALAYTYHVTQATTRFEVTDEGKNSCALFGLVYSTVGPDIAGGDFLENIIPDEADDGIKNMDASLAAELSVVTSDETADFVYDSLPESMYNENMEESTELSYTEVPDVSETEFYMSSDEGGTAELSFIFDEVTEYPEDDATIQTDENGLYSSVFWGTSDEIRKASEFSETVKQRLPKVMKPVSIPTKPAADVEWPVDKPALDAQGYPLYGETVVMDEEAGLWFYASPTLVVRVDRIFDPERVLTWYEARIFCDLERERFGSILYDPENPQKKHVQAREIARDNQVVFGMNTDYYTYRLGRNTIIGMIIRGGKLFFNRVPEANRRQFPNLDTLAMYEDGHWAVYRSDELTAEEYLENGAVDVYCFGPYLIRGGEFNPYLQVMSSGLTEQPRAAIGMVEPGHYFAVLAEGRIRNVSVGVDVQFLADHLMAEGCTEALNLDGGQTAVMCFMGQQITRIAIYQGSTNPRPTTELMGIGHSDLIDTNLKK